MVPTPRNNINQLRRHNIPSPPFKSLNQIRPMETTLFCFNERPIFFLKIRTRTSNPICNVNRMGKNRLYLQKKAKWKRNKLLYKICKKYEIYRFVDRWWISFFALERKFKKSIFIVWFSLKVQYYKNDRKRIFC